MTRFFALAAILATTAVASAAPLMGTVELRTTNVDTADPSDGSRVFVDVYDVFVDNPNDAAATSLEFLFPGGNFVDNNDGNFRNDGNLPIFFGQTIADSFFVTPAGNVLAGKEEVGPAGLDVAFTLAGDTALVEANSMGTLVAVLSVPTGEPVDITGFEGGAILRGGAREAISFIPEPSTALLAGLALVGFVARRK